MLLSACAAPSPGSGEALGGTSWQLVRFKGGDDTILTPDDRAKYTMKDGRLFLSLMADGGIYELEPSR